MSQQRNGALDSLRGFAAVLVFLLHAIGYLVFVDDSVTGAALLPRAAEFFDFGRVGVVIFFCLSGFLIAQSLRADDWRRAFPIKRALRLYPLFIVSVLGVLLVYQRPFSTLEALANLTMLPSFFGQPQYLELYWTLETEVVFYALFYALNLCGLVERPRSLWLLAAGFTVVFGASQLLLSSATLEELPLLFKRLPQHLGIMFFGAYLSTLPSKRLFCRGGLSLALIVLAPPLYALVEYAVAGFAGQPPMMLSYLTAVAIFLAALVFQPTSRVTEKIGLISYSLYLMHPFVIQLSYPYLPRAGTLVSIAIMLLLSLALAALCYYLVERPAIALSKKLCGRAQRKNHTAPQDAATLTAP